MWKLEWCPRLSASPLTFTPASPSCSQQEIPVMHRACGSNKCCSRWRQLRLKCSQRWQQCYHSIRLHVEVSAKLTALDSIRVTYVQLCNRALPLQAVFTEKKKKRPNLKISACMAGILRNPLRTQENEIHCEIIPLNHILINIHWQINIPRHQSVIDQGQCNREGVCVCVCVCVCACAIVEWELRL